MAFVSLLLIFVLTAVDQLIKLLVVTHLKPIGSFTLIPGFLELAYTENSGAAFGMLQNMSWVFSVITAILAVVIIVFIFRYKHHCFLTYASCIMVVAGGLGNMIDRMINSYVVDFIHVQFFPYIFNFADCLVTVGVVLFLIYFLFVMDKKKKSGNDDGEI